eukprot:367730-Rhodomonas_salina.1
MHLSGPRVAKDVTWFQIDFRLLVHHTRRQYRPPRTARVGRYRIASYARSEPGITYYMRRQLPHSIIR